MSLNDDERKTMVGLQMEKANRLVTGTGAWVTQMPIPATTL